MWSILRSSCLVKPMGDYRFVNIEYNYTRNRVCDFTPGKVYTRMNREIDLLPSQCKVIKSIMSPFDVSRVDVKTTPNNDIRRPIAG